MPCRRRRGDRCYSRATTFRKQTFRLRYDVDVMGRLSLSLAAAVVGGVLLVAEPLRCAAELMERPDYPILAIQARRSATVTAYVTVGADGYLGGKLSEEKSLFGPRILRR